MSDEKQLTVAELLARAGKGSEGGEQDKPRRRRRRNLEEGGVSVAELTGSIPKVKAKPAEARHSSVPLDHDSAPDDGVAAASTDVAEQQPAETRKTAEAEKPVAKTDEPAAKARAKKPSAKVEEPAAKSERVEPKAKKPSAKVEEPAAKSDESAAEAAKPLPSKEDTAVISAVDVADPAEPEPKKAPAEPPAGMAGNVAAAAAVPAGVATGVDVSRDNPAAADDVESTGELAVVDTGADPRGARVAAAVGTTAAGASTAGDTEVGAPGAADAEPVNSDGLDDGEADEEGISVWAMLGLAALGIIIGVVVFLVFDQLWLRLPNIVVGIAALVVTGLMVVGTKLLRTINDGLSMTLAGIVGLLMTFGPALILAL